jgi:hypothetical protein
MTSGAHPIPDAVLMAGAELAEALTAGGGAILSGFFGPENIVPAVPLSGGGELFFCSAGDQQPDGSNAAESTGYMAVQFGGPDSTRILIVQFSAGL